jgi:hypothetical protein
VVSSRRSAYTCPLAHHNLAARYTNTEGKRRCHTLRNRNQMVEGGPRQSSADSACTEAAIGDYDNGSD